MTRQEILQTIKGLSNSQGTYGRMYSELMEAEEDTRNAFLDSFTECKDVVDLIMAMES